MHRQLNGYQLMRLAAILGRLDALSAVLAGPAATGMPVVAPMLRQIRDELADLLGFENLLEDRREPGAGAEPPIQQPPVFTDDDVPF